MRHPQQKLTAITYRLNMHPRKCINVATRLEIYAHVRHDSPIALGTRNRPLKLRSKKRVSLQCHLDVGQHHQIGLKSTPFLLEITS